MLLNPLPVKRYADDIAIARRNEITTQEMIHASEPIMHRANLDIKASKRAVFYERHSGNNWYKGKHDKKTKITIQNKQITVSKRTEPCKYLGKSTSINSKDSCQVEEIISTYKAIVEKNMCMSTPINL